MIPTFQQWLMEVGMGGGGPGGGMEPPKQDPTKVSDVNAFKDFQLPGSNKLPPNPERTEITVDEKKLRMKKKMKKEK
ncbi:MAG: hypothetical protein ACW99G_00460 [Candidatus Thorarchaeota archaeon]|jgi:hypothetical protein